MNNFDTSLDALLQEATEHLNAGRKKEARRVLRQALDIDRNNLAIWELLWRAAYSVDEELFSLKRILSIDPKHQAAKRRLAVLQPDGTTSKGDSQPLSRTSPRRSSSRRTRRQATILLFVLGALMVVVCVSITGLTLYRGYVPFLFSSNLTATALAERNASCQALIDRTIQASDNFCNSSTSNTACYGNNTLRAELAPNVTRRFSERGDIIAVNELRRLSASPLNLMSNEWGIAVFHVMANLPRSLPGETVTMVVFGNTTLDNQSVNGESLESFYFSSELGQIVCEKIPFDGLMITSPDGSGIHFTVNGAELTLMGSASIQAVRNGNMEVSIYDGSARIVAGGEEQYIGAGQSSTVQLGGENGMQAISGPSASQALTGEELTMACTMTGQFCSPNEIDPISEQQAQGQIQNAITPTPTPTPTPTITRTASPTEPPTYTLVVLPTITPTKRPTLTATVTKPPSRTPGPTKTVTATNLPVLTPTGAAPSEPMCGSVILGAMTSPNPNELAMDITNNSGASITISRFFAYWVKLPTSQKIDKLFFNSLLVWNTSDPDSPSDIPAEGNWINGSDLTFPNKNPRTLLIQFPNDLQPTGYEVHIVFDIGCQVVGTK